MKQIIIVISLSFLTKFSYSQVTAAAALLTLNEIDATITKQLQSIDNLVTNSIGNTGNMLLSVTSRLRKEISETIGQADAVLRENQLNMYNQILNLTEEFNRAIKENVAQVDLINTRLTETADNFIIKKKQPVVYKYETQVFIKGHTKQYVFKVIGKNFNRSDYIYLTINGNNFKPIQSNYQELLFRIDSADIKSILPGIHYAEGKIVFNWRKGLFNEQVESRERFIIPIIPLELGKVNIFYEQAEKTKEYFKPVSYSCHCSTGSSDFWGDREKSSTAININPSSGRLFDPATVKVVRFSQRYGGGYTFSHKTEQQIKGEITCISQDRPRGGGGSSKITFTYQEFEYTYPLKTKRLKEMPITSVNPIIFELPDPIENKRANVKYAVIKSYDGQEIILTPSVGNKYFSMLINPATDDVIINWKQ